MQVGIGCEVGDGIVNQGDCFVGGGEVGIIDIEVLIYGFFQLFQVLQVVLGIGQYGFVEGV